MGCFNEVAIQCPNCDKQTVEQTKAGDCSLSFKHIQQADLLDLADVVHESKEGRVYCQHCGQKIMLDLQISILKYGLDWKPND
jgi:transcription elongation factor Elf1